jgi:hypothetical protein
MAEPEKAGRPLRYLLISVVGLLFSLAEALWYRAKGLHLLMPQPQT